MRRRDREIHNLREIENIFESARNLRIAFFDGEEVYILPISYGWEKKGETYCFYFHGAAQGRKTELIRSHPQVGFELDLDYEVTGEGDEACRYSAFYRSVIGNGLMEIVNDLSEKVHGLSLLMKHYTGKDDFSFREEMVSAVQVMKLTVTKFSGKAHPKTGFDMPPHS